MSSLPARAAFRLRNRVSGADRPLSRALSVLRGPSDRPGRSDPTGQAGHTGRAGRSAHRAPVRRVGVALAAGTAVLTVVSLLSAAPAVAATPDNPVGTFDVLTTALGSTSLTVGGWSFDPNSAASSSVDVYVDNTMAGRVLANRSRPDIAAAYPGYGPLHGYAATFPATPGTHNVCVYGINTGAGSNDLLGCRTISLKYDPIGYLDTATVTNDTVAVSGWALDPSTAASTTVSVTSDGTTLGTLTASVPRSDIAAAYPVFGPAHGFSGTFGGLTQGTHQICVRGINVGYGADSTLGCKTVSVKLNPFGSFDVLTGAHGVVGVTGWAADPNTTASIGVDVYSDGIFTMHVAATGNRPDVAAAYPGIGAAHGYIGSGGSLTQGNHTVCVYGINVGAGANSLLGCRTVAVSILPFGSFDVATQQRSNDQVIVGGWALDPDTADPISVDVYADGVGLQRVTASVARPDIATAYRNGTYHGFYAAVGHLTQGSHQVCAYAINVGPGNGNPSLGCKTVVISLNPFGSVDKVTRTSATTATITGWAMDPNSPNPITVSGTIDNASIGSAGAAISRPDVAAAFGNGALHGFSFTVTVPSTQQTVCITAGNLGPGTAVQIGCNDLPRFGATASSPPTSVKAVGGYASIVVSWQPPTDDGGATVRSYLVTAQPGNHTVTVAASVLTATIGGLPSGTTYITGVQARNDIGLSGSANSALVTTATVPPPQVTTSPVSTSRYIRNLDGSSADTSYYYAAGQADAARNVSGHAYMSLLDIGGQTTTGVLLSAIAKYVSYDVLVTAAKAYIDGYASRQASVAPVTIALGTNNDSTVTAQTGQLWATAVVNPLQAYAARYGGISIAGANDIEPGFRNGPTATRQWLSAFLGSTSAPFVFNGSADGCSQTSTGSGCNNGWTMNDLYWLSMGAAPGRMSALPQVYFSSMAKQWKYISLTGVLQGSPRIAFGGVLTEVVACQQAGSCTSMDGGTAWNTLWGQVQSDSRTALPALPWATDLRIN